MTEINIARQTEQYLRTTKNKFPLGSDEFYARKALDLALSSFKVGNYGIGAILLAVENGMVKEFYGRNQMMTGKGQWSVIGHAETSAILNYKNGRKPDKEYPQDTNDLTKNLVEGISCFGTLEPCPMCVSTLTNAGAKKSMSTVLDGELTVNDGKIISDGAALAIGEKAKHQPIVWQWIQAGLGLKFVQLQTDDKELVDLSKRIFTETREEIDAKLAKRK